MKNEKDSIIVIGDCEEPGLLELSFSKAKTFRRCKRKYQYKYVDKLRKKSKSTPLRKGSWIHECLETLYSKGDWRIGYDNYKKETWDKMFQEEQVEHGDLPQEVERIMERYVKTYKDEEMKTIAVEQDFKVRIPNTKIVLTGIMDWIAEDDMGIWIIDHKCMKKIPDEEYRLTDIQLSLYYMIMNIIKDRLPISKDNIAGVMFNYIRTKSPTVPKLLKRGGLSKRKDIDTDYHTYYNAIIENNLDPKDYEDILETIKHNTFFRRNRLPKSKHLVKEAAYDMVCTGKDIINNKSFPRNFTRDCSWDCEYKDLCIAEVHGHDTSFIIEAEYEIDKEGKENDEDNE